MTFTSTRRHCPDAATTSRSPSMPPAPRAYPDLLDLLGRLDRRVRQERPVPPAWTELTARQGPPDRPDPKVLPAQPGPSGRPDPKVLRGQRGQRGPPGRPGPPPSSEPTPSASSKRGRHGSVHHWIDHVERRDRIPSNNMSAAGQTLNISENPALFSLIGTNYGGNGTTTFQLPDLTSAAPDNTIYLICVSGVFP